MYGKVFGRFFVEQDLGIACDDTPDTCTFSELIETYDHWERVVTHLPFKIKQLYTMFETSDVHPHVIKCMKLFDRVLVPFEYLARILVSHGVNAVATNFYTSELIRSKPMVLQKKKSDKLVFLYVGTNDIRKNVVTLAKVFAQVANGTPHILFIKTNTASGLVQSPNIRLVLDKISLGELAGLYNMCDYVISCTRGEGVGLPMLEASYFGKPIIAHDQGVFIDVKKYVNVPWHTIPSKEVPIDYSHVPDFLKKVFYGAWWEVDEECLSNVISNFLRTSPLALVKEGLDHNSHLDQNPAV
jgi:glycosyltransferase involved in cell wall biosynthesis